MLKKTRRNLSTLSYLEAIQRQLVWGVRDGDELLDLLLLRPAQSMHTDRSPITLGYLTVLPSLQ